GKDLMRAWYGDDRLFGHGGQDYLDGHIGNDSLYGGDDYDRLRGGEGDDLLSGQNGTDWLEGEEGNDYLKGEQSWDWLYGNEGHDTLWGGQDNDKLKGGEGNDVFVFDRYAAFDSQQMGIDVILDFGDGADRIKLDKTAFTALRSSAGAGFSRGGEFAMVNSDDLVATSSAYILYSSSSGNLFYNENGGAAGLGSGGQFAILRDAPHLDADSFIISD
ncbi:MAG: calcium-binding protein, partial [Cyanobacteria bacterium P01_A01_bin.40]